MAERRPPKTEGTGTIAGAGAGGVVTAEGSDEVDEFGFAPRPASPASFGGAGEPEQPHASDGIAADASKDAGPLHEPEKGGADG